MRWLFLVMIALSNASQVPIVLAMPGAGLPRGALAVVSVLWLILSAFWLVRRGRPHPAVDVADCCALLLVGSAGGSSSIVVSAMFPVVFFTSTYGSTKRVFLRTSGFLAAFLAALAWSDDFDVRFLLGYVISMLALAAVMHLLTVSFKRNERSLVHQRTLASAGARFVAAQTRDDVYEAAIDSAHELLANDPAISTALVLPSGQDVVVVAARGWHADVLMGKRFAAVSFDPTVASIHIPSQMSPFTTVIMAPLVLAGELVGALALASPAAIPDDTEEAVRALAAETTLSLETLSSTERFRSLVQHSTDVFTIVGPDGAISYQSPSFERLTGRLPEATIGAPLTTFLHPQDAAQLTRQLEDRSISTLLLELRWLHVDGQWRQTEAIISNLLDDPNVKGWTFNTRDVSERARLEIELRQAQKLESVGRLAAGIAHEINTPIQFVGDNLRFLKTAMVEAFDPVNGDPDTDAAWLRLEVPLAIEQSLDGVQRISSIVRALTEFAHPDSREQEPADLNQALLSTITVARSELRGVAKVVTDMRDLQLVRCHVGDMNQVFLNLLVNAAHAVADADRGDQGLIKISSFRDGDQAVIRIEDNGSGIPEAIRGRIFDPFFTTREVGSGTGQGLALARSIVVDKHAGSIDFSSTVGHGTVFVVRLPIDGDNFVSTPLAA